MTESDARVVLITGAAGGLGRAYVKGFAAAGYRVAAADLRPPEQAIAQLGVSGVLPVQVDVASESSVEQMVSEVNDAFGRIDVLVNNAAYFSTIEKQPFDQITVAEWDKAFAVNVRGAWLCARAVVPVMRRLGAGRIINTASMTLHGGGIPGFAHYVSTKAAIVGLTRALARELGADNIGVNTVSPDYIAHEGELFARQPEMTDILASQRAFARPQAPDDMVGTVLFLAGEGSAFVTGQDIWVNGGRLFH